MSLTLVFILQVIASQGTYVQPRVMGVIKLQNDRSLTSAPYRPFDVYMKQKHGRLPSASTKPPGISADTFVYMYGVSAYLLVIPSNTLFSPSFLYIQHWY